MVKEILILGQGSFIVLNGVLQIIALNFLIASSFLQVSVVVIPVEIICETISLLQSWNMAVTQLLVCIIAKQHIVWRKYYL